MLFYGQDYPLKSVECATALQNGLEQLLNKDERLIGFHQTKNKFTYYITIQKEGTIEFQQFRLSTHKAKYAFYSNRTFLIKNNQDFAELAMHIRKYLGYVQ